MARLLTIELVFPYAYRAARSRGKSHHTAEDIAQSVVEGALRTPPATLTTSYVWACVRHRHADLVRCRQDDMVPVGLPSGDEEEHGWDDANRLSGIPDPSPLPWDDPTPESLDVAPLLPYAGLPPDLEAALRAVYLDGLTEREAARQLGVSRHCVRDRAARAVARLRRAFGH